LRWMATLVVLFLMVPVVSASPRVIINEIMYNPADGNSDYSGEWLELYNPNDFPINLSNWVVEYDGHQEFLFPSNAILPERGYLIVSRDTVWFQETYGIGNLGDDLFGNLSSYRFSNTGTHWIAIRNNENTVIDNVTYSNRCPENYTIEKIDDLGSSDATGDNWACSLENGGTPLRQNSVYVPFLSGLPVILVIVALLLARRW